MRALKPFSLILSGLLILGLSGCDHCTEPERVCCPRERASTGSITGVVTFIGEPPPRRVVQLPPGIALPDVTSVVDEQLIVNPTNHGIQNAIIRLVDVEDRSPIKIPEDSPVINMKGCIYSPHVLLVPPNSNVVFLNPDHRIHTVHGTTPLDFINPRSARSLAPNMTALVYKAKYLAEPEIIEILDDIYPWMKCYIVVHDPRYAAISDADGKFEIKNLRPGKYKMNVFHEKFGERTDEVEVKAGQAAFQDIKYGPRPGK